MAILHMPPIPSFPARNWFIGKALPPVKLRNLLLFSIQQGDFTTQPLQLRFLLEPLTKDEKKIGGRECDYEKYRISFLGGGGAVEGVHERDDSSNSYSCHHRWIRRRCFANCERTRLRRRLPHFAP